MTGREEDKCTRKARTADWLSKGTNKIPTDKIFVLILTIDIIFYLIDWNQ